MEFTDGYTHSNDIYMKMQDTITRSEKLTLQENTNFKFLDRYLLPKGKNKTPYYYILYQNKIQVKSLSKRYSPQLVSQGLARSTPSLFSEVTLHLLLGYDTQRQIFTFISKEVRL